MQCAVELQVQVPRSPSLHAHEDDAFQCPCEGGQFLQNPVINGHLVRNKQIVRSNYLVQVHGSKEDLKDSSQHVVCRNLAAYLAADGLDCALPVLGEVHLLVRATMAGFWGVTMLRHLDRRVSVAGCLGSCQILHKCMHEVVCHNLDLWCMRCVPSIYYISSPSCILYARTCMHAPSSSPCIIVHMPHACSIASPSAICTCKYTIVLPALDAHACKEHAAR